MGKTTDVKMRIAQIKSGSPVECEILAVIEYNDIDTDLEKEYHTKFSTKRVRGEWFALSKDDLLSIIPKSDEIEELLNEMHEWGFFSLGISELHGIGTKATLMRMQGLMNYSELSEEERNYLTSLF